MVNNMNQYQDHPLEACAERIAEIMQAAPTTQFYQKWTCAKCGERVTMSIPNKLFTRGFHEDCGFTTDIRKSGCNYMLHFSRHMEDQ